MFILKIILTPDGIASIFYFYIKTMSSNKKIDIMKVKYICKSPMIYIIYLYTGLGICMIYFSPKLRKEVFSLSSTTHIVILSILDDHLTNWKNW